MGLMKEIFMKEAEQNFWKKPFFGMEAMLKNKDEKELEEERFEVIKGDFSTEITCKFSQEGYLVSISYNSKQLPNIDKDKKIKKLEELIKDAVEAKDFRAAMILQKQLDSLNQQN